MKQLELNLNPGPEKQFTPYELGVYRYILNRLVGKGLVEDIDREYIISEIRGWSLLINCLLYGSESMSIFKRVFFEKDIKDGYII